MIQQISNSPPTVNKTDQYFKETVEKKTQTNSSPISKDIATLLWLWEA